jgi:hypothetical protein
MTDLKAAMRPIVGQDLDGPVPSVPAERIRRAQRAPAAHGDRLGTELGRTKARLLELEDAYRSAQREYAKILSSRAWRLTTPIHKLADRLKRR